MNLLAENIQVVLANGDIAETHKLRHYFDTVFAAEDSGQEFAVNLEHIWRVGYSRKDVAVRALVTQFLQGSDYEVYHDHLEVPKNGRPTEHYHLTTSCAEFLAVRANREVFEVYRNCRKALRAMLRPVTPGTYKEALTALLAEVTQREALEAQAALDAPKIAFTEAVALAGNPIPISAVAKYLKLPGIGRNKLFKLLRTDKILRANNEPYQQHIDNGHFAVELQVYEAGEKGGRTAGTTRCTSKGLIYLALRYKHLA